MRETTCRGTIGFCGAEALRPGPDALLTCEGDVDGCAGNSKSTVDGGGGIAPRTTLGSNRALEGLRPGTLDAKDTDRDVDLVGEIETLLFPAVGPRDPSGSPTRRGSVTGRADGGEVAWICLAGGGIKGIESRDSILRAELDAEALRGIGILEDLEGREVIKADGLGSIMGLGTIAEKRMSKS